MEKDTQEKPYSRSGVEAPWYRARDLTEEEREIFRRRSIQSQSEKQRALEENEIEFARPINIPKLDPNELMPSRNTNGFTSLSLFSGGGGIDLGFDRAGFTHVASYEILDFAGNTIQRNRPEWNVFSGENGDVTQVDWRTYRDSVDVIHGGPPCQPFSTSGRQMGVRDVRDMIPEMVRAILGILPKALVMENVPGLLSAKFSRYLQEEFYTPLQKNYTITMFPLKAADFGVPQVRRRCIFVGFKDREAAQLYRQPRPTHKWTRFRELKSDNSSQHAMKFMLDSPDLHQCMGVREALGFPHIGYDNLAPTLRSSLTGPRHTTSVLSSTSAQRAWAALEIWPNGIQENRAKASQYPAKHGHARLAIEDCALIQGFPESWIFIPPVYKAGGQIGNSVVPPMAYWIARSIEPVLQEMA